MRRQKLPKFGSELGQEANEANEPRTFYCMQPANWGGKAVEFRQKAQTDFVRDAMEERTEKGDAEVPNKKLLLLFE